MDFDEPSNPGLPFALGAPGRLNVPEPGIDSSLGCSLAACTAARVHVPVLARGYIGSTVVTFDLHCTLMLAAYCGAPQRATTYH